MSSYEARIENTCMRCETVTVSNQKFTTHENNWRITRTQPVSQPGALHIITRVPSSFSSAVISTSHSHLPSTWVLFRTCPEVRRPVLLSSGARSLVSESVRCTWLRPNCMVFLLKKLKRDLSFFCGGSVLVALFSLHVIESRFGLDAR